MAFVVFKLGGSLLSRHDLGDRLKEVLLQRAEDRKLIVVGGGAAADIVREWSDIHSLSEEAAHWLAIRSLSLNRGLVLSLIPELREVIARDEAEAVWSRGNDTLLLDVETCLRQAETQDRSPLPHNWDVTSDSIAAWVALRWQADELILLKSVDAPLESSFDIAVQSDFVDPFFPRVATEVPRISWCNLNWDPCRIVAWR